ncbi:thioredoxin family protein [bacterium AH-315-N03]|nr:thioredoxin family protein [bacterium AH-315-N03]
MSERKREKSLGVIVGGGLFVLAGLAAGVAGAQGRSGASAALSIGDRIPSREVRMLSVDGSHRTIGEMRGASGTLVVFTCNHCPWSQAWEARLTALGNEFRERGVGVIAINPNDPDAPASARATFDRMQRRFAGTSAAAGTRFSPDTYEEMQRRARDAGMRFPYVVDGTSDVARSFGATRTPEAYLFDHRDRLVYHGAIDDNPFEESAVEDRFLRDALLARVARRRPSRAESRSVGCSIELREASGAPE